MDTKIILVTIAAIFVITKFVLEKQHSDDILNGCEDDPKKYTFTGMLRSLWRDRRDAKRLRRLQEIESRKSLQKTPERKTNKVRVQSYRDKKNGGTDSDT